MKPIRLASGALALLSAASLALAGCGDEDTSSTKAIDAPALAFVGPLTGDSANLGINIRNAIKLAVQEANAAGGTQITLKEFDTQGAPAQATTVKDQYINDENIIGVVGPTFSGETKAVLPDLQDNGLVMISPSATNVQLPEVVSDQTVFHRTIPDDDAQGKALTGYITKVLKPAKVAYVNDNSEYGKGLADGTRDAVAAAGVATAVEDVVDPASQDFSVAVNKVKASGADVVFYGGYYTEAGRFRKQLADAGVTATFLSGDGAFDPGFIAAGGTQAEGARLSCPCNLATEEAGGKLGKFATDYKALNGIDPGTYSTEAYDAANILIKGIKDGKNSRSLLLDYVEDLGSYDGLSRKIEFEDNGNVKSTDVYFFEVKNGKMSALGSSTDLIK